MVAYFLYSDNWFLVHPLLDEFITELVAGLFSSGQDFSLEYEFLQVVSTHQYTLGDVLVREDFTVAVGKDIVCNTPFNVSNLLCNIRGLLKEIYE